MHADLNEADSRNFHCNGSRIMFSCEFFRLDLGCMVRCNSNINNSLKTSE